MSTEIGNLLVSSPDVCGGRLRIDGTQITINRIAALHKAGYGAEEIVDQYPLLTLAQVYAALSYYHANQEEIDADIEAEKTEATGVQPEHRSRIEAFKQLQCSLNLTSAKAAEWQDAIREARR